MIKEGRNIIYKIIMDSKNNYYVLKLKENYILDEYIPYYKINVEFEKKIDSKKIKNEVKNKVIESKKIKNEVRNEIKNIIKNLSFDNTLGFLNHDTIDLLKENYNDLKDNILELMNSIEDLDNKVTEDKIYEDMNLIIEKAILNDLNIIKSRIKQSKEKHLYLIDNKMDYLENNYDLILGEIIKLILTCDINKISQIRNLLYNIMITNINGSNIIKDITTILLNNKKIPDLCMYSIIKYSCLYDPSIARSRREIIHLDGFIIKVMKILYDNDDYDP